MAPIASNAAPALAEFETEQRPLSSEERRIVSWCLWSLAALSTASMAGVAFSLYLVNHAPLLLIGLSPLGRHLLLVAPVVDPVAFVIVGVFRRLLFYLAFFYLGRALGPMGIVWIESRAARFGRFVRWLERLFSRASHAVVLLIAGPTVSALAGISGMRLPVYLSLAIPSLVVRMLLILGFAEWLREPIERVLTLIDRYWIPGTVILVIAVGVHQWRRWARRPRSR